MEEVLLKVVHVHIYLVAAIFTLVLLRILAYLAYFEKGI